MRPCVVNGGQKTRTLETGEHTRVRALLTEYRGSFLAVFQDFAWKCAADGSGCRPSESPRVVFMFSEVYFLLAEKVLSV